MMIFFFVALMLQTLLAIPTVVAAGSLCKAQPGTPNWPAEAKWTELNNTLGGSLLKPLPPASVCDPGLPNFNKDLCAEVGMQWFNLTFHYNDPVSVDWPNWQDDACLPSSVYNVTVQCDPKPFPQYVVDASTKEHVEQAVAFARDNQVRLTVKGTGHDYLGRSTSPGLSVWTNKLKGISLIDFKPDCNSGETVKAVKVSAGQRWGDVYPFLSQYNLACVGGADPNVGIGGYLLGGGHSPISNLFGLGADNVLEFEVVTPQGTAVVANKDTNSELFWSLRGGGGSAFGVLLSATLRTFPAPSGPSFLLNVTGTPEDASKNANANFYKTLARFHKMLPDFAKGGFSGYYYIANASTAGEATSDAGATPSRKLKRDNSADAPAHQPQALYFFGSAWNKNESDVQALIQPFMEFANSTSGVINSFIPFPAAPFNSGTSVNSIDSAGGNSLLTSRLFDEESLQDEEKMAATLQKFEYDFLIGHLVIAPGVHQFSADSAAANPLWRKAVTHLVSGGGYPFKDTAQKQIQEDRMTNVLGKAFRDHGGDFGCYLNEANVNEVDHQTAFWGNHYERLVAFKRQSDPLGVFWCSSCVGSEDWVLGEDNVLCKKE